MSNILHSIDRLCTCICFKLLILNAILARYIKLLQFHLMELPYRKVADSAQDRCKGTYGYSIVQGLPFYIFRVVLVISMKGW